MITRRTASLGFLTMIGAISLTGAGRTAALAQAPRVRLPLDEFLQNDRLLKALRKGVAAMKARKPSDPLSWFFQAAIHGVTPQAVATAAASDPGVLKVDQGRVWNQCPHNGQNSANFLPWHRAYTHHFEAILRLHAEEDDFAVPYWNYEEPENWTFPKAFGIEHLDGNTKNDDPSNINPLFLAERDYFLCGYEHPFTDQLPLTGLTARAVDTTRVMAAPVFFGDTESTGVGGGIADEDSGTRGLLEQSPHDQIHRAVGGTVVGTDGNGGQAVAIGAMAIPMTAGFDPIFPVHHANIDRIWKLWSCTPGKSWGKLPDKAWFDAAPWFFFDTDGKEVNRARKDYFDYRALGVAFKDDDPSCTPLQLPPGIVNEVVAMSMVADKVVPAAASETLMVRSPIVAGTAEPTAIALHAPDAGADMMARLRLSPDDKTLPVSITVHEIDISKVHAAGFDAYLVPQGGDASTLTPGSAGYLGPVNLFNHGERFDQTFDASAALIDLHQSEVEGLTLVLVPYLLSTPPKTAGGAIAFQTGELRAAGVSITLGARSNSQPPGHQH